MQQFILPLSPAPSYKVEEFIVSTANKEIFEVIKNWPTKWGHLPYPYSILIYGSPSSGKTYLSRIWQNINSAYLLNPTNLNNEILNFNSAFIIENIENWPEEELLHNFNLINENKKYLLVTSSLMYPNFNLRDLSSRFKSIAKYEIKLPDDELIKIFLFKLFSNKSVKVSKKVLDFLLKYLPREFNKIIELVDQINNYGLAQRHSITIPLIKKVLNIK